MKKIYYTILALIVLATFAYHFSTLQSTDVSIIKNDTSVTAE